MIIIQGPQIYNFLYMSAYNLQVNLTQRRLRICSFLGVKAPLQIAQVTYLVTELVIELVSYWVWKNFDLIHIMGISWGYYEDILGISWWYHGDIMGISWDIMGISWGYLGYIMGISWWYHSDIMGILWEYPGDIMGISWWYHGDIMMISWGCYWAIMGILKG